MSSLLPAPSQHEIVAERVSQFHAKLAAEKSQYHAAPDSAEFVDLKFLPSDASLGRFFDDAPSRSTPAEPQQPQPPSVIWIRLRELYGDSYSVFGTEIGPEDVVQGQLADCYFHSALSVLSNQPNRIRDLFLSCDDVVGHYQIRLFSNGDWVVLSIDDYVPCDALTRRPLCARASAGKCWPLLLEKACGDRRIVESCRLTDDIFCVRCTDTPNCMVPTRLSAAATCRRRSLI
jgi:hypothetical protein